LELVSSGFHLVLPLRTHAVELVRFGPLCLCRRRALVRPRAQGHVLTSACQPDLFCHPRLVLLLPRAATRTVICAAFATRGDARTELDAS
jgi:hypothetical protein